VTGNLLHQRRQRMIAEALDRAPDPVGGAYARYNRQFEQEVREAVAHGAG